MIDPDEHIGLLFWVVQRMRVPGNINPHELVNEGYFILREAAGRYDETRATFFTFAAKSVRLGLSQHINASRCIGYIPTHAMTAFRSIERHRSLADGSQIESLIDETIKYNQSNTGLNHGKERWDARAYYTWKLGERSLDAVLNPGGDRSPGAHYTLADTVVDDTPDALELLDDEQRREFVWRLLAETRLSLREREIIEARFLRDEPETLLEIGERYGLSRERIRQLEARALLKLREMAERLLLTE